MDFNEKVAIVTGAASGIGEEIVKALLINGIKHVAILDINEIIGKALVDTLIKHYGHNRVMFLKADVTKYSSLEDAFEETIKKYNRIDIVINNAGIVNEENFELTININLNGVIRGTELGFKYLSKTKDGNGGHILNISSVSGLEPLFAAPFYTASKSGVLGLVRSLGHPENNTDSTVSVTCLCPHFTTTSLGFFGINKDIIDKFEYAVSGLQQKPDCVGRAAVHVIKYGETGSVWAVKQGDLYRVNIPDWNTFIELSIQNI